jgi:competence ComEA-like helix-hairpin-helix protein
MRNPNLPNTTFLLVGFVIVMLAATAVRWDGQGYRGDRVIPIHTGSRFDLNATSADALCLLPGIGPRLARRIVQARAHRGGFTQVEQLHHISGIGPRVVSRIRPWIVCGPR